MILNGTGVELTKVRYYDGKEIATISREVLENEVNRRAIIRRNVFGQRWVLKINESSEGDPKGVKRWRVWLYVLVFGCILVALAFGIYITVIESKLSSPTTPNQILMDNISPPPRTKQKFVVSNEGISVEQILNQLNKTRIFTTLQPNPIQPISTPTSTPKKSSICNCSSSSDVCMKMKLLQPPLCVKSVDKRDPSGCGGLCRVNTQFCRVLDRQRSVYECVNNTNTLKCPEGHFNCGNMCVPQVKRCDGFRHCGDNSDEENCDCNLKTHFNCGNYTSCIENQRRCDGRVDCWDGSDEIGCVNECSTGMVACINGTGCIPKENFCDGTPDCDDGSDEPTGC